MAFISWNKDLELGIDKVDSQHKMLVDMINELHDSILEGKSYEKMGDILTGLLYYAQTHFATEEQLFEVHRYPERQVHIREHNDFIMKISSRFDKMEKGELVLSVDIARFLRDWLINHVMISDKKFVPYVKEIRVL
jgi:hemerythrin